MGVLPDEPVYDGNGNLKYDGTYSYDWDEENFLTKVRAGETTEIVAEYEYDALGRRSQKAVTEGSATTRYLWGGATNYAEYSDSDVWQRVYVYGPGIDEPLMVKEADGTKNYVHRDGKNTVIAVSAGGVGNASVTNKFTMDAWGNGADSDVSPFKFTSRRLDKETGNFYYRNRYYDPDTGRFMSNDPIGYGDGLNMYAYVGNDPVNFMDPMGLSDCPTSVSACISAIRWDLWSNTEIWMSAEEAACLRNSNLPYCSDDGPGSEGGGEEPKAEDICDREKISATVGVDLDVTLEEIFGDDFKDLWFGLSGGLALGFDRDMLISGIASDPVGFWLNPGQRSSVVASSTREIGLYYSVRNDYKGLDVSASVATSLNLNGGIAGFHGPSEVVEYGAGPISGGFDILPMRDGSGSNESAKIWNLEYGWSIPLKLKDTKLLYPMGAKSKEDTNVFARYSLDGCKK